MSEVNARHEAPGANTGLLQEVLASDPRAVRGFLHCLGSLNSTLCKSTQAQVHNLNNPDLWDQLLRFLAFGRWENCTDQDWGLHPESIERVNQSIVEAFTEDKSGLETLVKQKLLTRTLADASEPVQFASAFLLGLRGDVRAIEPLCLIIDTGSKKWKIRAVKALASIHDARCGPPLVKALAADRGALHRLARRALQSLGPLAKEAWVGALNHPDSHIRWHAARGLVTIGDTRATYLLSEGLLDEDYAVRWATADTLSSLGASAVPATLTVLSHHPMSEPLRQAAIHALNGIRSPQTRELVQPLLAALRGPAPSVEAPAVAQQLLLHWESGREG